MFGQRFIGEPCQRIGGSRERLIPATLGRDFFEDPRSERVLFFHGQLGGFGERPHEEIGHSSTFVNGGLLPRLSYEVFQHLAAQIDAQLAELDCALDTDVKTFIDLLRAADVPAIVATTNSAGGR